MGIEKVQFQVNQDGQEQRVFDVAFPRDSGINFAWILGNLMDYIGNDVHFVDFKYQDDEFDLVTFSADHEILEGVAIVEATNQDTFFIHATAVLSRIAPTEDYGAKTDNSEKVAESVSLRAVWEQFVVFLKAVNVAAQAHLIDALQFGVKELKQDPSNPRKAFDGAIGMFPEEPSHERIKLARMVAEISSEQWDKVRSFAVSLPVEAWSLVEATIPKMVASVGDSHLVNTLTSLLQRGFTTGDESKSFEGEINPAASLMDIARLFMSRLANFVSPQSPERRLSVEIKSAENDEEAILTQPGMHVIRTWHVKNISDNALPQGVKLSVEADPDKLIGEDAAAVVLPQIQPGESVEVSQLLQAPFQTGLFHAEFVLKLLYGQGPVVGPKMPVDIFVLE